MPTSSVASHDRIILRDLAKRVTEIASLPVMAERRALWVRHNKLQPGRPMILVFPEGAWREMILPEDLHCQGEKARAMEWNLRHRIYYHENIFDDTVIEGDWVVNRRVQVGDWGLEVKRIPSHEATGAWKFDPVLKSRDDLQKLHYPRVSYDAEGTAQDLEEAQDLFGDILEVKLKGVAHISFHLMQLYTDFRGLEQTLVDMADDPQFVQDAMTFFTEGCEHILQQYIDLNLLSLNNDGTYHSSGGVGYIDELPLPDYNPDRIRPCDMWASAESQELALVSPRMHARFALQYEKRLLKPFGLNGYGCCEDLSRKLEDVLTIPNIRRISISPFADVDRSAERLENQAIFSWKPLPSHLVGYFDAEMVRGYIQHTLDVTRDCTLEMILKDTHTCEFHPERFTEWTKIARQLVEG